LLKAENWAWDWEGMENEAILHLDEAEDEMLNGLGDDDGPAADTSGDHTVGDVDEGPTAGDTDGSHAAGDADEGPTVEDAAAGPTVKDAAAGH